MTGKSIPAKIRAPPRLPHTGLKGYGVFNTPPTGGRVIPIYMVYQCPAAPDVQLDGSRGRGRAVEHQGGVGGTSQTYPEGGARQLTRAGHPARSPPTPTNKLLPVVPAR